MTEPLAKSVGAPERDEARVERWGENMSNVILATIAAAIVLAVLGLFTGVSLWFAVAAVGVTLVLLLVRVGFTMYLEWRDVEWG